MAQTDVRAQVRARFVRPLDDFETRRVVFWHDSDGSFEDAFDNLASEGIAGARPVRFAKVEEGANFSLKLRVCRECAADDFLIYTRAQKNLSARGLQDNWLADVEIIAEHFQADFASMLMDDLGATDSALEGIEEFRDFFNAQERKEKFKRLMPKAGTRQDVILGVIGSILGASDLSTECLVRTYLFALGSGLDPLSSLGKFGADAAWSSFVSKRLGYSGDLTSMDDMCAHVLLTAASFQLPDGMLDGLSSRISTPHGQFCLNVVHDWMADGKMATSLYDACRRVEQLCNLESLFSKFSALQLVEADVFPCINERILTDLVGSMAQGADRTDEATRVIQRRKDLRWYTRVSSHFAALEAAVSAQRFYREHIQGFHYAVPSEVWKAYTDLKSGWYLMDTAYRRFCTAVDECGKSIADLPELLRDEMENLACWMERIYVNWFLAESNACWVNASEQAWEQAGYVEEVPRQRRFFDEKVASGAAGAKKTLVIVSDALRFEVAADLAARLERETKGTVDLSSMQGTFPTVTEFGMAALLPHKSLGLSWNDGGIFVNGNLPAMSTAQREEILKASKPNSRCVQSKDLVNAKRDQRRGLVGDAEFVYVFHNSIDAVGEEYSTEHKVFDACEDAISELVSLVRIATGDLNFTRILITADHGFLYTRNPLEERDKISKKDISSNAVKVGRRYAISEGPDLDDCLFIKMNMGDIDGGSYTGLAPRECVRIKKAGPGENYVHGGLSLQECCVPVIQFRNKRAGTKGFEEQRKAGFRLLSTARRVSSMMFKIELFQKERVEGKVCAAEYEICMTDAAGNEVTDVRKAHADMTNPDETARVAKLQFSLKAGRQYDSKKPYYLVCRDKADGSIAWKEEFQIDVTFVPMDDFGF